MKERQVSTQDELDQALKDGDRPILIGGGNFEVRYSSQVRAYGSSQVTACGSSHVIGGKQIKIVKPKTATQWCSFYGLPIKSGTVTLFKAVSDDYKSNRGFDYTPGTTPEAPDWDGGKIECGCGLHFSPRPFMTLKFFNKAKRFIACPVKVASIAVHPDGDYPEKVKAPRCCGPVWECDIDGNPVTTVKQKAG